MAVPAVAVYASIKGILLKRLLTLIACAMLSLPVAAAVTPVVSSVTPASGPAAGGTDVVIHGSGFTTSCPPNVDFCSSAEPVVWFGGITAAASHFVDASTINATTPLHLPGNTGVSVCEFEGCTTLSNGFNFTGDISDAFERMLIPVLLPPIPGLFGSSFVTTLKLFNGSATANVQVYGLSTPCPGILCGPVNLYEVPFVVYRKSSSDEAYVTYDGNPGRIVYYPKAQAGDLAAGLRVWDTSRTSITIGTEVPLIREHAFHSDTIALLGAPVDYRFRNKLRIYSASPDQTQVKVTLGTASFVITLRAGSSIFEPAYADFDGFPSTQGDGPPSVGLRVLVEPLVPGTRIWAFISATNNESQQITTITPQ